MYVCMLSFMVLIQGIVKVYSIYRSDIDKV